MEQNLHPESRPGNLSLSIGEVEVYLFGPAVIPGLINPDFLRHNDIASADWTIERPVMMDNQVSVVRYTNGLTFRATDRYLAVSQRPTSQGSTMDDIICPEVATKCLELIPVERPYETVGFDFSGTVDVTGQAAKHLESPLRTLRNRLVHNNVLPEVETRWRYRFEGKEITLYVFEIEAPNSNELVGLFFNAEIRRPVEGEDEQQQQRFIHKVLEEWKEDANEFRLISDTFCSMYVAKE